MKPRRAQYLFLFLLAINMPINALAYDRERVETNLASDYAECAAYYMFMSNSDEKLKNDPGLKRAAELSYELAVGLSNIKVTNARIELSTNKMMKEIDYSLSNGAILINKYGEFCEEILENPEERMKYWFNKKD